jgi:hypothetical protein
MSPTRSLAFVAAALCLATTARADNRAWSAGKKVMPANLQVVLGLKVDSIRSSQLFQKLWPKALDGSGPMKTHFEKIKKVCKVDFIDQLDSVVIGMNAPEQGIIVVALKTTQKDFDACLQKIAKVDKKPVTIVPDGQVTKYSGLSPKDTYVRWLTKDTFAMVTAADDKDVLMKMTDGGIADDKAFTAPLAAVKTAGAIWFVANKQQDLDQIQVKMKAAYGQADIKGGKLIVDFHIVVESATSASDAAARATGQLDLLKQSGKIPAEYQGLLSGLTFSSSGPELLLAASVAEKDIVAALGTVFP